MPSLTITESAEGERGCGYRQPGGLYLVTSPGELAACGKTPLACDICPTCDAGIKPTRSFQWINPARFFKGKKCRFDPVDCPSCILSTFPEKAGLIWIGSRFYPTAEKWNKEVGRLGVSRRISAIPKDLFLNETLVLVGHREGVQRGHEECGGRGCKSCEGTGTVGVPGIVFAFIPTAIEYVVDEKDSEEKLERLAERGVDLVKVVPVEEK